MTTHRLASAVAVAVVLTAAAALRAEGSGGTAPGIAVQPAVESAELASATPMGMAILDWLGVGKPLRDAHIRVFGYSEYGYTYGFHHGSGGVGAGGVKGDTLLRNRLFDTERGNHFQHNQDDYTIERYIADVSKFDVGGRLELVYGTDAYLLHAHGMDFYGAGGIGSFGTAGDARDPLEQLDVLQAYIDVNIPVMQGLNLRLGKFNIPIGYEGISPLDSPLYSHSYLATCVQPSTGTGGLASLDINPQWAASLGMIRGYEQALEDNNGSVSFLGSVTYKPTAKTALTTTFVSGPELARTDFPGYSVSGHYTNLVDFSATCAITDKFVLGLNGDVGNTSIPSGFRGNSYADWYGTAFYAAYTCNQYVTFNARAEWFYDSDSFRLPSTAGGNMNIYELTIGASITPFAKIALLRDVRIRPEIRWDHAEDKVFNNFAGTLRDREQVTAAVDIILPF